MSVFEVALARDDLIATVRSMNATCTVCCTGSLCNTGLVPALEETQTAGATAVSAHALLGAALLAWALVWV